MPQGPKNTKQNHPCTPLKMCHDTYFQVFYQKKSYFSSFCTFFVRMWMHQKCFKLHTRSFTNAFQGVSNSFETYINACIATTIRKQHLLKLIFEKKNNAQNIKISNLHHFSTNVEKNARVPKINSTYPGDVFTCLRDLKTPNRTIRALP